MKIPGVTYPDTRRWKGAVEVISKLQTEGESAYLVGGCVRDILLNIPEPGDYDIATSSPVEKTLQLFPAAGRLGIKYGVLTIDYLEFKYQIAIFRRDDPASDGRRPEKIYPAGLEEDSRRRDFTVNAIYFDPNNEEFRDPQGGIPDLRQGILRIIGEPVRRLREDHLRILRAVRFASRFNFDIDPESAAALENCAGMVADLSPDRIRDEISRIFIEGNKKYAVQLLHLWGILSILWKFLEIDVSHDFFKEITSAIEQSGCDNSNRCWAAFFQPLFLELGIKAVDRALLKLSFPRKDKKTIRELLLSNEWIATGKK